MSNWNGTVFWGWRDQGTDHLPEDVHDEFNLATVSEGQSYYGAVIKNLDHKTLYSASRITREPARGRLADPGYSDQTKYMAEAFHFLAGLFRKLNTPEAYKTYVFFVNLAPKEHVATPTFRSKKERVDNIHEGVAKFGEVIASSVTQTFSECDWALLQLLKD